MYDHKLSSSWLALELGVRPSTVSRWQSGATRPGNPGLVLRIADKLMVRDLVLRQALLNAAGYARYHAHDTGTQSPVAPVHSLPSQDSEPAAIAASEEIPKIFISYSWSSSELQQWVTELAKKLRSDGVDVHLDSWDLQFGQDLLSYIEAMLTNKHITKVLVICDKSYVQKADANQGGVGREVQILSKGRASQSEYKKIIPIVVEKEANERPCLPAFLSNRFYLDMSTSELTEQNYRPLVRNIYDEPPAEKPPLGAKPYAILKPMHTPRAGSTVIRPPAITTIAAGIDLAGYSKQTSIVRDSQGVLTVFVRTKTGELAFIRSDNQMQKWSSPTIFDHTTAVDGLLHVAAAIDSADYIHLIWGQVPEAGDAIYGLLDGETWIKKEIIGTGVFARNIAVDSANHPHVVWTNVDLFYSTNNGYQWLGPKSVARGFWHPDILVDQNDDVLLFVNSGGFRPKPNVSVYLIDNADGKWNQPQRISTSQFWSGAVASAINNYGDIYVAWMGTPTAEGGSDQVFFSRRVGHQWQSPFPVGEVNWAASLTGQESPAITFDSNGVLYICWRGLTEKNRPVIFVRALVPETSSIADKTTGWSPIIILDDRECSDVWWPSIADAKFKHRVPGVDIVWRADHGRQWTIKHAHVTYP